VAQQQEHRIVPVDGQPVLLDSQAGTQPHPLLLVLAGLGEDAVTMRDGTGFTALAALSGFDVAYPDPPQDPPMPAATPRAQSAHAMTAAAVVNGQPRATNRTSNSPAEDPDPSGSPQASPTSSKSSATPAPSPSASRSPTKPTGTPTPSPSASPSSTKKASPTPSPSPPRPTPSKRPSPLHPGTRAWNAGSCCAPTSRDDVRYLVDVVHAVEATVPVDASRVYIVGFSNGGMMALDAVCSAPDVFAAAGSVAGPFLGSHCARPIWRHLAAAPDDVVPPGGGIPAGLPSMGIVRDWCGCSFPATTTETSRFGMFASVVVSPTGGHFWPTPSSNTWPYDPERDLWGYVSKFHL
jgi:pimeloyl-ACP methyl ester carboxylesterase